MLVIAKIADMKTRNTKLKRLVSDILQIEPQPLTPKDILEKVHRSVPTAAFSTIFRMLKQFEADGLVTRIDWRERGSRYEWAADPHHHIVCTICGRIQDIHDKDLNFSEEKVQAATGYSVKHHAIELEGICPSCQHPESTITQ